MRLKSNTILGVVGLILIVVGMLGYSGVIANALTKIIIQTKCEVSDISATSDSLTAYLPPMNYWHEGMDIWTSFDEGDNILPVGENVYFLVWWMNETDEVVVGHVDLTVIKPSGERISPSVDTGQDAAAGKNQGHAVTFGPVLIESYGDYQIEADISGSLEEAPAGDFYINGEKVSADMTITLHTKELTFEFIGTQNVDAITGVTMLVDEKSPTSRKIFEGNLSKVSSETWRKTLTLPEDGTYIAHGWYETLVGTVKAMSIQISCEEEVTDAQIAWLSVIGLGFLLGLVGIGREYNKRRRGP